MDKQTQTAGETAIQKYDYDGSTITFAKGDNVMVNATQMANKFGKKAKDWLKTQQSKEFLKSLSEGKNIPSSDLVQVMYGNSGGTWMHEDVAIEFARWLSPMFAIWCNDRIKELAREGVATVSDDDAVIAHAMQVLQRRLDEKQAQIQAAQGTIEAQSAEIKALAPLADYTKEVLQSNATYTLTQVSKDLGFPSVYKFTAWAHLAGILYYQSGQWMPMSRYTGRGWFATRTCKFVKADGSIGSNISTVVTEAGRAMLHNALAQWRRRTAAQAAQRQAQPAQPAQPETVFHIDTDWRPSETVIIEEGGAR